MHPTFTPPPIHPFISASAAHPPGVGEAEREEGAQGVDGRDEEDADDVALDALLLFFGRGGGGREGSGDGLKKKRLMRREMNEEEVSQVMIHDLGLRWDDRSIDLALDAGGSASRGALVMIDDSARVAVREAINILGPIDSSFMAGYTSSLRIRPPPPQNTNAPWDGVVHQVLVDGDARDDQADASGQRSERQAPRAVGLEATHDGAVVCPVLWGRIGKEAQRCESSDEGIIQR